MYGRITLASDGDTKITCRPSLSIAPPSVPLETSCLNDNYCWSVTQEKNWRNQTYGNVNIKSFDTVLLVVTRHNSEFNLYRVNLKVGTLHEKYSKFSVESINATKKLTILIKFVPYFMNTPFHIKVTKKMIF